MPKLFYWLVLLAFGHFQIEIALCNERLQELLDPKGEALTSFFVDCDEDGDRSLTEHEVSACFGLVTDPKDRADR